VEKILRVNDLRLRKVVTTESITQTAANLKYKKKVVRRWGCLAAMKKLNYLASILPHAGLEPKQYAAAKRIVRALGAYVDDTIAEFGRGTEERSVLAPKVTQLATALTAILKVRRYNLIINLDSDPFDAASMCSLKFDSAAPLYRPVPRYFRSLIKELSPVLVNFLRVAARFIDMREAAPAN